MLIIGERINASRKSIAEAIECLDTDVIKNEAKTQVEAGADYIDVNAGTFPRKEAEYLQWVIETVQEATDYPLSIDSSDPDVIKTVIPFVKKNLIINSISLEPARLRGILPLAAEYRAKVIAICESEDKIAETTKDKLRMAHQLVESVTKEGIPLNDLYIDPLVYPLATNDQSAMATLDAIEVIMKEFPGVHTTCGLTNVSYGIPNRKLINRSFLTAAVTRGLNSAILDPTDTQLFGALKAALLVAGKDEFCSEYLAAFRKGRLK
jgi:5-methyltetrahydrofolate--homocysteine methyltransferase